MAFRVPGRSGVCALLAAGLLLAAAAQAPIAAVERAFEAQPAAHLQAAPRVPVQTKIPTKTTLTSASTLTFGARLKLTGTVTPAAAPGSVTVTRYRFLAGAWKLIGSYRVTLKAGAFSYSIKPSGKGKWRFVATYQGAAVGLTSYLKSKSPVKVVIVK
jgi:hypothetical protein